MNCHDYLTDIERRLEEQIERGRAVAKRVDQRQLNWSPGPDRWNLGQIFAHMMLANSHYEPAIKTAIDQASRAKIGDSIQHTFFGRFIIRGAGPDGNAPVPKSLRPKAGPYDATICEKWAAQTQRLLDLARSAHSVDLCTAKVKNPFIPFLRLNLADCFQILAEHTERHIRQIESLADKAAQSVRATA